MGDNLPAIDLGVGRTAVALAGGRDHACALLDDGTVKCWGSNSVGQLGQGDTASRGDNANEMGDNLPAIPLGAGRTAVAIAAGRDHSCALLDNGTVKCWGNNASGQLGQGDTTNRGDNANEMGDNLLAIDLGTGRTAVDIRTGWYHTCALLDNSTVKCWGDNGNGQLGQGDGNKRGDNANEMGDNLLAIDLGTGRTATEIATGLNHNCALLDDSTVKCWGYNSNGQLGQGDAADRGVNANEMGDNLLPIDLGTF
jgi:alpha-tubulin suppressor-like RCC1 family protein